MKLPTESPKNFVLNLRDTLVGDMAQREKDCKNWDSLFYTGATVDKDTAAIANIISNIIRTEAGNLFSPDNLTFRLEYELDTPDQILQRAARAGSFLSRELRDADADLEFGDAVELALRHGSAFGQLVWDDDGFAADVIPMYAVGVLNGKAKSLYGKDQPAFMVRYSVPIEQFKEQLMKLRGTSDLARAFDGQDGEQTPAMNEGTKVVFGLNQPIGSSSTSQAGFVNLLPRPPYIPSSNSNGRQVELDAVWIQQDDGRWATVYVVEGNTIGTDQWRNFMAIDENGHENPELAKRHPYWYVCPHPVKGSLFGRSRIADFAEAQGYVRRHVDGMDHILAMQERPAHIGYGAIQPAEIYRQELRSPGGWVTETGPNAKVQPQAPQMPPDMLAYIEAGVQWGQSAANKPPVVQGRGERGVRAGAHAETLMLAASAGERRPALRTVRQCGDMGDLGLAMLCVKDASQLTDASGETFTLETLPDGFHVYCNGHTASPLFASEYVAMVDELMRAGAIGPEEYLMLRNPSGYDMLENALKKREAAQAKELASLPPEDRIKLLAGGHGRKK